jgi:hypothetical protein
VRAGRLGDGRGRHRVVDGLPVASTTFEWYLLEALPGS